MYGYIYLTTNLINNKKYIGMHKSSVFDPNYKGSGKILRKAINKYGWDSFKVEILKECMTPEELYKEESDYINKYNALNSKEFYNLKEGGNGGWKVNGISVKKGVKISEEGRRNISNAHKGKRYTEAQAKAHKGLLAGEKNPFYGKTFSDEARKQMSKIRKGRFWVNKDGVNTVIDPWELDKYLAEGYQRGMLQSEKRISRIDSFSRKKFYWMTKGTENKKVYTDETDKIEFLMSQGFVRGRYVPKRK